jgi:ATP-binding cassette, subfamily B, bacterial
MKLLIKYLKRHKGVLTSAAVLGVINQVFSLLDPQIFRLIIDRYATQLDQYTRVEFLQGVSVLILASIVAAFISRTAKAFQDYYVNITTERVGADLYTDGVRHTFSLPFSIFEDTRSGEVLGKLQKARQDSKALVDSAINVAFLSIIGMLFVLIYAYYVHYIIGLAYTLLIPILGSFIFILSSRIKKVQAEIVKETVKLAGATTETLRNVELVKSLGLENQEINRLNNVNDEILALEIKKVKTVRTLSFIQGTLINALRSGLLLLMLWYVFGGGITLGEFFSLWFYSFAIFSPLQEVGRVAQNYQETKASMKALETLLNVEKEKKPDNPLRVEKISEVKSDNISFSYEETSLEHKNGTIDGLNFKIKSNETIAFVGPSGSGKSTILKLIVGLYTANKGSLSYNGIDITKFDMSELRKRIGYVSQDTQLFAGSLRQNLLFVKPNANDSECLKALNDAEASQILERGGEGLDTKIGEGGIKLSGGERQRLAIARALLRHPDILIFDEATSSLDSITEQAITDTLHTLSKNSKDRMTILVAHRLSTIIHADRIYVLEKGKVVEEGSHAELLKKGNLYYALWREQIGEGN